MIRIASRIDNLLFMDDHKQYRVGSCCGVYTKSVDCKTFIQPQNAKWGVATVVEPLERSRTCGMLAEALCELG